jgi:DNA polymerase III subunit gamma/tau
MSTPYTILANQFRPNRLSQVIGQEHITQSIHFLLSAEKIHHAYLLTGKHGTGKTTLARILAQSLNCHQRTEQMDPCGTCPHCTSMQTNQSLDVIELDAASRTKVEQMRELLEQMHYPPQQARYKVFIIDEVHMLSTHSFNALLKTLEEPLPHIIFILATTQIQKIPATILSRCLQFQLHPIHTDAMIPALTAVLDKKNTPHESAALNIIAKHSQGSMRDALNLLEQALLIAGTKSLTPAHVTTITGQISSQQLEQLIELMSTGKLTEIIALCEQFDTQQACFQTLMHDLMTAIFKRLSQNNLQPFNQTQWALCYQIAQNNSQNLLHAPCPKIAFVMVMMQINLCLFAKPQTTPATQGPQPPCTKPATTTVQQTSNNTAKTPTPHPESPLNIEVLRALPSLSGIAKTLLKQATLTLDQQTCTLTLAHNLKPMLTPKTHQSLLAAIQTLAPEITQLSPQFTPSSDQQSHLTKLTPFTQTLTSPPPITETES